MSDVAAVLTWWFLTEVFGLVALPLAFRLFQLLPDQGYGVSKALGLLLSSYVFWLLGMLGFLHNDSGSILFALFATVAISLFLYARRPPFVYGQAGAGRGDPAPIDIAPGVSLTAWLRAHWRLVLVTEIVFAASFFGWAVYRANVPRILTAGGEKFMELAFLNGFKRTAALPPLDPWLAGYAISYYYFGYLIMSNLIRLSGVAPSVGFNIGGALLFALTVTGAFSLVYNLVALFRARDEATGQTSQPMASSEAHRGLRSAWVWVAVLGVVFVALLGNLEGALEVAHWNGIGGAGFWKWLDIADLDGPPPDAATREGAGDRLVRPVSGPGWGWWWRGSRVIFDYELNDWLRRGDEAASPPPHRRENIDEFPFFSFLLGDMHPHVLALPFIMLALTVSLTLFQRGLATRVLPGEVPGQVLGISQSHLLLFALIFGALGFLNTWDFPIQWVVAVGAYTLGRLSYQPTGPRLGGEATEEHVGGETPPLPTNSVRLHTRPVLILAVALAAGGLLLYAPFYTSFQSQAGGPLVHVHSSTRLAHFVVMFGPLLFILVSFLAWGVWRARERDELGVRTGLWTGGLLLLGALGVLLLTALAILGLPTVRNLVAPELPLDPGTIARHYLGMRLSAPWVTLLLAGMIATAAALLRAGSFSHTVRFSLLLLIAGAFMTLAPEYVYLKDVFGVRLNTIFKFYYQAWVLWAIAAAGAVYSMVSGERGFALGPPARWLFGGGLAVMIGLGLLYPLAAVPDRVGEFPEAATLDGTAYLADEQPADYAAVQWLNRHVANAPTILETHTLGGYAYEGRVSAQTGLPTLVGWGNHEWQWRGNTTVQGERYPAIEELYSTTDAQRTLTLLDEYDIRYVYVGPLERSKWPAAGLDKFDRLMEIVYDRDGVKIYQRRVLVGDRAGE